MENLLEYLLKSAGVLSIFVLVYHLLLRKLTFFKANRAFLLTGMIASVLVPFIEITQTVYVQQPQLVLTPQELSALMARQAVIAESAPFDYWELALYSYIAVVVFFIGKMLVELSSLMRLLKSGRHIRSGSFIMVTLSRKLTPFSFFKYICYSEAESESPELDLIIDHEKVHARQWHSLDLLATHLYCAIFWINPLAWILKRQIGENLEFLADAQAKTNNSKGMHYERTLLSAAASHMQPALANNFFTPFIKKRIIMLQKEASAKWNAYKYALILPVIVLFLYSFNVVEQIEYIPQTQQSNLSDQVALSPKENPATPRLEVMPENLTSSNILPEKSGSNNASTDPTISFITKSVSFNITATDDEAYLEEKKEFLKKQYQVDFKYSRLKIENGRIVRIKLTLDDNNGYKASQSFSNDKGIPEICVEGVVDEDKAAWTMGKCSSTKNKTSYSISIPSPEYPGYLISGDLSEIEMNTDALLNMLETDSLVGFSKVQIEQMKINLDSLSTELKKQFSEINMDSIQRIYSNRMATGYLNVNPPLVIVNGVKMDQDQFEAMNPEVIKAVSVLKDRKDIEVYGASGAHGVILVETDSTVAGKGYQTSYFLDANDSIMDSKRYLVEVERLKSQLKRDTLIKIKRKQLELAREKMEKSRAAALEQRIEAKKERQMSRIEANRLFSANAMEHVFVTRDMSEAGFEKLAEEMKAHGYDFTIKTHRMSGDKLRKLKIDVDGVQHTYVANEGIKELKIVYFKNQEAPLVSMLPNS